MIALVIEIPEPPFSIGDTVIVIKDWERRGMYGIVKDITFTEMSFSLADGVKVKPFWSNALIEVQGISKNGSTVVNTAGKYYETFGANQLALKTD